jgi:tetratricopeptide (TPR) repeat protein
MGLPALDLTRELAEGREAPRREVKDGSDVLALANLGRATERGPAAGGAKAAKRVRLLKAALQRIRAREYPRAAELALDALALDPESAEANHLLAIALDRLGRLSRAIGYYERAWKADPENPDILHNLGLLAWKLDMLKGAETFFRLALAREPTNPSVIVNFAGVLRDTNRFDDAIELLRTAIYRDETNVHLWNSIGAISLDAGQPEAAITFLQESLRLDPAQPRAWNNIAIAYGITGRKGEAVAAYDHALTMPMPPADAAQVRYSRAMALLAAGRVAEGWDAYDARRDTNYANHLFVQLPEPYWDGTTSPQGKRLFVIAEQGLGDEVLFLEAVRGLLAEGATIALAVERRLVSLVARSYPGVYVTRHITKEREALTRRWVERPEAFRPFDGWTLFATVLKRYRRAVDAFPRTAFLTPDPARVAEQRAAIEALPEGLKVGVLWKSKLMTGQRVKYFSPLEAWGPILKTPGVTFVSLQYGETAHDIADAEAKFGTKLHALPGLDLMNDLEGVAAACAGLDLVLGPANATSNIAGAVGCPTWTMSVTNHWSRFSTDGLPFYPDARAFAPPTYGDWTAMTRQVAGELAALVAARGVPAQGPVSQALAHPQEGAAP